MRRHSMLVTAVAMLLATAGCEPADRSVGAPTATENLGGPSEAVTFSLRTHCGIDETKFEGRYYEALKPLSDGQGNPPAGWGNPNQIGTMQILSATEAEFRDPAGHVVLFRVRPQATAFARPCLD